MPIGPGRQRDRPWTTLPGLDHQIKSKLREAENKLKLIGRGVPDTPEEQHHYLLSKIQEFTEGIIKVINGDEEGSSEDLNLFLNLRRLFDMFEKSIKESCDTYICKLKNDNRGDAYESQYRGRELKGFINYRKFENILRKHIMTFQGPAVCLLREVADLINKCFMEVVSRCFLQFHNLQTAAMAKFEEISHRQKEEAEEMIKLQFRMEQIIYCQDSLYCKKLHCAQLSAAKDPEGEQSQLSVNQLTLHLKSYLQTSTTRLSSQIPLIIQHYILREITSDLQSQMILMIEERENMNLLEEKDSMCGERNKLKERIRRLSLALERLQDFSKQM